MKLLDKLKNALFEEEYVEVEEKPVRKEKPIAKKMVLPKEEKSILQEEPEVEKKDFVFPIMEEEDFVDLTDHQEVVEESHDEKEEYLFEEKQEPISPKAVYQEKREEQPTLYSGGKMKEPPLQMPEYGFEKKKDKQSFTPSPIISPIYGILDKNYKKEDVISKKEVRLSSYGSNSKMDLDAVRAKAYGETDDSVFEEELKPEENESQNSPVEEQEEEVLLDISDNHTPTVPKVTVGDAEEYFEDLGLEYNIDYKDASKEKATGRRSNLRKEAQEEEAQVEDNLFDLIDTMYEKKEEE